MKFPYWVQKWLSKTGEWQTLRKFRMIEQANAFEAKLRNRFNGTYRTKILS